MQIEIFIIRLMLLRLSIFDLSRMFHNIAHYRGASFKVVLDPYRVHFHEISKALRNLELELKIILVIP